MYHSHYAALLVFSTASNFPNICNVFDAVNEEASGPIMCIFCKQVVYLSEKCKTEKFRSLLRFLQYHLQITNPVWPRNNAFLKLLILKQTPGNSDLKGREHINFYASWKSIFFFGILDSLGPNVEFSSVPPYSCKTSLVPSPFTCATNTPAPCPLFNYLLQTSKYEFLF
jgi:hypothetical protein